MEYFESVVEFVDEHLLWVVILFFAAVLVEAIVFFARSRSNYGFETDNFYIAVVSNITGLLGLYVVSCICVGFVNCVKAQDYHFWTNYNAFIFDSVAGQWITYIVAGISLVVLFCVIPLEIIGRLLGAVLGTALVLLVGYFVGFLLYVIVAFLWIVLKLIWFVFTGFFQSIYRFIINYWKWILIVLVTPGIIYGALRSLVNYIVSLKEEVFTRDES